MAAVAPPRASSASPPPRSAPGASTSMALPPLNTNTSSRGLQRTSSYAKNRLSTYSTASSKQGRSRPQSTVFPVFHSSLPYTLVRDFAYGPTQPLFYGPLPESHSELSTPASEVTRRLSDPPTWENSRGGWSAIPLDPSGEQLPQTAFDNGQDGPPWSEDEDIHSPVVTSARHHKKHKSNLVDFDRTGSIRNIDDHSQGRHYQHRDGTPRYYLNENTDSPDSSYISYPPPHQEEDLGRHISQPARSLPGRTYGSDDEMSDASSDDGFRDESRFSRDYQFTITDPAEEMHGKAVALFDFARENDNELPLIEGQVILVSYRHGQGWLVAQDPKTGESGLVPEEYVRLLRDIEGGWNGLMDGDGGAHDGLMSPVSAGPEARTPTQAQHHDDAFDNANNKHYTPVVSSFSTSSKDFVQPYAQHLLGSQLSTPTASSGQHFGRVHGDSPEKKLVVDNDKTETIKVDSAISHP